MNHTLPRIVIAAALLVILSGPALHARLGETEAQIKVRFGEPQPELALPSEPLPGRTISRYRVGEIYVEVTYRDGKSVKESVQDRSSNDHLVEALLEKYSDGEKWLGWDEISIRPTGREPSKADAAFIFKRTNLRDDGSISRLEGSRHVRDSGAIIDEVTTISFEVPDFQLWQRKLLRDSPEGQKTKLEELKQFDVF